MQLAEQNQQAEDVVQTETASESTQEASEGVKEASNGVGEVQEGAEGGSTPYTPDFSYRVADETKELEEWVRPLLRDAETEKRIKDLYTRADAFGFQKSKREKAEAERDAAKREYEGLAQWVNGMIALRDGGELDEFFSKVRLDEKKVMQWMLNKLEAQEKLKDLPPHLQQAYNERQEYKRKARELEESNQALQAEYQQQMIAARKNELDRVLSSPEIATLANQYDQRAGAPGSFMRLVIRHGNAEFVESNGQKDLTPQQAVSEVLAILGLQQATQGAGQAPKPNGSATTTPKVVTPQKTEVIPNVGSGGASAPTHKKPKSIDDIRAIAKAMRDAG